LSNTKKQTTQKVVCFVLETTIGQTTKVRPI